MTTPPEPRTEAGRALAAHLDSVSRTPYSGISFPDADYDIARIEAAARSDTLAEVEKAVGDVPGLGLAPHREVWNDNIIERAAVLRVIEQLQKG